MKTRKVAILFLIVGMMTMALVGQTSAAGTGKTPAVKGAQPWMVALVDSGTADAHEGQFCGGSLIAKEWVLTAAHCLEGVKDATEIDVVIGRYQLSSNEGERITASALAIHAGYPNDKDNQDNDIALIRLSRPATKGSPIRLITTANQYVDDPGTIARVTGWGVLTENGETTPDILQGVNVPIVTQELCQDVYGDDLMADNLCAGKKQGGADSCYGDSGGPLVAKDRAGNPVQIGVVSWGDECGAADSYGVYERLTEYNGWINQVMAGTVKTLTPSDLPNNDVEDEWESDEPWTDTADSDENFIDLSKIVLPKGFELTSEGVEDGEYSVSYADANGNYIDIYASAEQWAFSAEDRPFIQKIKGVEVLLDSDEGEQMALFNLDGNGVDIYATITASQMQQLVKTIVQ